MEKSADIQIYERPVEKHSFFYDPFIGDGSSSTYRELIESFAKLMYMAQQN